jgi:hypothetical protein
MEAPEVPIEKVHEDLHEHAHAHGKPGWAMGVALSTALLAVLAAIASLLAGHYANEGMLDQMKASNEWSRYQAKSVKENVLRSKLEVLTALEKKVSPKDQEKLAEYRKEEEEIGENAKKLGESSEHHMDLHARLARAVTLFQVGIGVSAIAVLTDRRMFWFGGMVCGVIGTFFLITAFLH